MGKAIDSDLLLLARKAAAAEIRPIDDIRSSARYRATVSGNLVVEFLDRLRSTSAESNGSKDVLTRWNHLPPDEAVKIILPCCGSKAWAEGMLARRPFPDEAALLVASSEVWRSLSRSDWMEAFQSHPRIGESRPASPFSTPSALAQSVEWSAQEQQKVGDAKNAVKIALAEANREYERRFDRIFIVCATGKSAAEILEILQRRLSNDADTELHEAAEQQRQITQIRLKKWLQE
jgi:2-oxo-4-hydroxy-4-carboxy-5-ureidoimidazoline decarboxylase